RSIEIQAPAQIAIRREAITIADKIALRMKTMNRGADHQERPVELAAVERDEAITLVQIVPELLENLLLGAGHQRAVAVLPRDQFRLAGNFVHRARLAGLGVHDADGDDASGER